jgi:putative chitinase
MLTPDWVRSLAPRARDTYVDALTAPEGWNTLTTHAVNTSALRLAGFLANVMQETGGLTIVRESMNYTTANRLRQVWPRRFGSKSDAELAPYLHNELRLADAVYNGRMGNAAGSDDGFIYRGWGLLQTTGKDDIIRYCALVGRDPIADPSTLNDMSVSLVAACAEWQQGGCNELLDKGEFDAACAVINVGNKSRIGAVEGLSDRRAWFAQVKRALGSGEIVLEEPVSSAIDWEPTIHSTDPHWSEA